MSNCFSVSHRLSLPECVVYRSGVCSACWECLLISVPTLIWPVRPSLNPCYYYEYCISCLSLVLSLTGLLVDLAKECTQAASATTIPESGRAGWSTLHCPAYTTTSTTTATSTAAPAQDLARQRPWLLSAFSTEPSAARTAYLKKLFKPHPTTTTAPTTAAEMDIDTLVLRRYKPPSSAQQPGSTTTGSAPDEDCFLELSSGATQLGPEKTLELWAAAPYVWPGQSPFWSPLLLRKMLLEPLKEYIQHHTDEQVCLYTVLVLVYNTILDYSCIVYSISLSFAFLCIVGGCNRYYRRSH